MLKQEQNVQEVGGDLPFLPRTGSPPMRCLWRLCRTWARVSGGGGVKGPQWEQLTFSRAECSTPVISCDKQSLNSILQMKKQSQETQVTDLNLKERGSGQLPGSWSSHCPAQLEGMAKEVMLRSMWKNRQKCFHLGVWQPKASDTESMRSSQYLLSEPLGADRQDHFWVVPSPCSDSFPTSLEYPSISSSTQVQFTF